jgi:cell division protein FtsI (penicillin-binding protein 3)
VKQRSGEVALKAISYRWRSTLVLGLVVAGAVGLAARAVELQLLDHGFLAKQGDERSMRVVKIAAHRGAITDRSGEPLAVSTPVDSVWVNPQELNDNIDQLPKLAKAHHQQSRSLIPLLGAAHAARAGGAHQSIGNSGRVPAARIPALLPRGRSGGARGGVHDRR